MPRALLLCSVLLAASPPIVAAAASATEDIPLSAPTVAYARTLGLDAASTRASFIADLVRLIYARPEVKQPDVAAALGVDRQKRGGADNSGIAVPLPLTADIWSRAIFRRTVPPQELVTTILVDRQAALLCRGLAALDDETLAFLGERPALLSELYQHAAPAISAFGGSLQIRAGQIMTPGGPANTPLWEGLIGERAATPERFIHVVYATADGRLAYLYDTIAALDAPHAAFALGTWIPEGGARSERFQALASALVHGYREWRLDEHPFNRPVNDFTIVVTRLRVDRSGTPMPPAERSFWTEAFGFDDATGSAARDAEKGFIDAAFLAAALGVNDMYDRADRVDQVSFAQRVFPEATAATARDVVQVLRALPRQRMLMWTLDRMGITSPSVYTVASRRAHDVTGGDPNRMFWTLAQFQGALALISRARIAETIDTPTAQRLVLSLVAVPLVNDKYEGGVARWIERDLLTAMPAASRPEARLIGGLSGLHARTATPRVEWEGQAYRLDFAAAEARRLQDVRERQGGYSMDVALDLARIARGPSERGGRPGDTAARTLASLAASFGSRSKNTLADVLPPGVTQPTSPRERIDRAVGELSRVDEQRDPERAQRAVAPLVETADVVLTEALLSLIYASELGDPDGPALLASNVALRHDFGFMLPDSEQRTRRAWEVPRQEFQPGVPWHVTGSVLGLDVALASLTLRHINLDRFADAPHLSSVEREAFAVGAALMNTHTLHDADRDAIVNAIARGRTRVTASSGDAAQAGALADAVGLDGWRRRTLQWTLGNKPADVPALFSLGELMMLGGGAPGANLDAWGTSGFASAGCLCTRLVTPGEWRLFAGRSQLAFLSFIVPDLNLRVAMALAELHMPAALERPVLAAAVQDFIDEAAPFDGNDWWSLAHWAQELPRQRIEDYIAAAAAVDGPLVPVDEPPFAGLR